MSVKFTNLQVARGVLRIPSSFTGAKDGTFVRKSDFLRPGDAIPEGMLSDRECRVLLANGTIAEISTPEGVRAAAEAAARHMSNWNVNPATLGNKDLEELLVMIQGIDPQYPLDDLDEDAARRLLSKDFDPDMDRPERPAVSRRDPVSRLTHDGAKDSGNSPLTDETAAKLAELQDRAKTPDAAGGAANGWGADDEDPRDGSEADGDN